MQVAVNHLRHSEQERTLYVRLQGPTPLRRATLQVAARRSLGLTLPHDPRPQIESLVFSTVGYQGTHDLSKLNPESFNQLVNGYELVMGIQKVGVFEVQAVLGEEQRLTVRQCNQFAEQLADYRVVAIRPHSYLGRVLALTVLGMDDGPNTELVQNIGAKLCLLLDGLAL